MLQPEGFYIWVDDLEAAIDFYEKLFERKISHREKNRWADFEEAFPFRIGIYNHSIDREQRVEGNNITPELRTDNVDTEHTRIQALNPKTISEIIVLEQPVLYKYFQFEDNWGNVWEVAEHYYN